MFSFLSKQFIFQPSNFLFRTYRTFLQKEFDVSQFCTINIKCPYNIIVNPIDVFETQEKVFVNFIGDNNNPNLPKIECGKCDDTVNIDVSRNGDGKDYTLNVETSVKASLRITGNDSNIHIGSFYGQFIEVDSDNSSVGLSKCQCEKISLATNKGNIICKDVIQAGNIELLIRDSGNIAADRIQGLMLNASTANGSISIGSSYCQNSTFEIDVGELNLRNMHKHIMIKINQEGFLNIVGLDGDLLVHMKKGLVDIQFAKIAENSKILVEDQSTLVLRLSEECQKNNLLEVLTDSLIVSDNINMDCKRNGNVSVFSPRDDPGKTLSKLEVRCDGSHVSINSTSWSELFQSSLKYKI